MSRRVDERRHARRVRSELPVRIGTKEARLKDISTLGLCCAVSTPVDEMTKVHLDLELPEGQVGVNGAVVRCERAEQGGYELAVYFTEIGDADRGTLERFVATAGAA